MAADKRAHSPDRDAGALVAVKRQKTTDNAVALADNGVKRTSGLMAPIMQLVGHGAEVLAARFSPTGEVVASGSADKCIFMWRTYGECENYMMLSGHKNAVLELSWFQDGARIVSCSADKSVRGWDVEVGQQIKRVNEHTGIVNSVSTLRRGSPLFVSGGDDNTIKVWDMRVKRSTCSMTDAFQVTSTCFSEAGDQVYSAGLDNAIKVWDLRKPGQASLVLKGHSDTVTGIKLSPDGTHLLSNSMDNTLRIWDMRPFAPSNRCAKVLSSHMHSFDKTLLRCDWSPDGEQVAAGSADRMVYIWEVASRRLLYKLPGHLGSVNDVAFHPQEPIVLSASSDKTLYLGELVE